MRFPQEVRDMIYKYCLIQREEIKPFPTAIECEDDQRSVGKLALSIHDKAGRKIGDTRYAMYLPCLALLCVNKRINHEAAVILMGKNVWRLSWTIFSQLRLNACAFTGHYSTFSRHVTMEFSMFDASHKDLLEISKRELKKGNSHGVSRARILK